MIVGVFEHEIEEAATLNELKRWYAEWVQGVNELNADEEDFDNKVTSLMDKHNIEFKITDIEVTQDEMMGKYNGR